MDQITAPTLQIDGLSVSFATEAGRLQALKDVSFAVPKGRITGIVGESGCGKSTLINAILGLLADNGEVTAGAIRLEGKDDLTRLSSREMRAMRGLRISTVFQDPMGSLDPRQSVESLLVEGMKAHGLAKDLESKPLEELGREYSVVGVLNHDFSHPLFDRREVHDIYREWRKVFNEYNPPRFAVAEAWVVPEHQHLYASMDELGQSFNFDFAQANWYADEFRKAIAAGLKAAAETGGSTTTWVMNNHDVPRSPSRYGLPQVKGAPYHQLPHDWLLRNDAS